MLMPLLYCAATDLEDNPEAFVNQKSILVHPVGEELVTFFTTGMHLHYLYALLAQQAATLCYLLPLEQTGWVKGILMGVWITYHSVSGNGNAKYHAWNEYLNCMAILNEETPKFCLVTEYTEHKLSCEHLTKPVFALWALIRYSMVYL